MFTIIETIYINAFHQRLKNCLISGIFSRVRCTVHMVRLNCLYSGPNELRWCFVRVSVACPQTEEIYTQITFSKTQTQRLLSSAGGRYLRDLDGFFRETFEYTSFRTLFFSTIYCRPTDITLRD